MSSTSNRVGVLLVNLGTPASPDVADVRRYLRQFLMDGRVLDMPTWRRYLLVHLLILPRRPKRSAESYLKIWTEQGSPLRVHGEELCRKVRHRLGSRRPVALAMRYGEPSIERALESVCSQGADRIVVLPLYAQSSDASTGSTLAELDRVLAQHFPEVRVESVAPFFEHPSYLAAKAGMLSSFLEHRDAERVLFSYHGLPVRQLVRATPELGCMQSESCCESTEARRRCYRAQCFANAEALADRVGLERSQYRVCFQSRLGRTPWITPFTDQVLVEEAERGCRRIVVVSGFVADCLETLEEIAIAGRELFRAQGGEELELVPAPNAQDAWANAVVDLIEEASSRFGSEPLPGGPD